MAKPTPQQVAQRLIILKYQVVHALALPPRELLDNIYSKWSKEEQNKLTDGFKERSQQLIESMKSNQLWNMMTHEEKEFLESALPNIKSQQHLNAMWRLESVAVLLWSLGIVKEFPPFDTQSDIELLELIPYEDIHKFIYEAILLPDEVIERKRSLAELWHWRSINRQLLEMNKIPPLNSSYPSFDQIVQEVANEAFKQGDLSNVVDNDSLAKGKSYRNLVDEEWSEVRSITIERHHALNWPCGYAKANMWDKTPTNT
jgi:hypothetical protein